MDIAEPQYNTTNIDINVNRTMYSENTVRVTKMFHTVQGEAPYTGYPCLFLRLAGCNRGAKIGMDCELCDTAFSYSEGIDYTIFDLGKQIIEELKPYDSPMLVITGGEPLLQTPALAKLIDYLNVCVPKQTLIQFETNGDISPLALLRRLASSPTTFPDKVYCHFVVSPKGTPFRHFWFSKLTLDQWNLIEETKSKFFLRRVVSVYTPYEDIDPEWLNNEIFTSRYLSAWMMYKDGGTLDYEKTIPNSKHVLSLIKKYDYRLRQSTQSHVFLDIE